MTRRTRARIGAGLLAAGLVAGAPTLGAEAGVDPPALRASGLALRNLRDGILGVGHAFMDLQTGLFGEAAIAAGKLTQLASDTLALVDRNPLSDPLLQGFFSGHLARTAYLWHVAGSEALLGSHGLEAEWWALSDAARFNPLLGEDDADALSGPLPLDPLEFIGERRCHASVYRAHSLGLGLAALIYDDLWMRPLGASARVLQLPRLGESLERHGEDAFRRAARFQW